MIDRSFIDIAPQRHEALAMCVMASLLFTAFPANAAQQGSAQSQHPSIAANNGPLSVEEAAVLEAIRKRVASDTRIKSAFTISIEHMTRNDNKTVDPIVVINGTAVSYDELFAVNSDVQSTTDFIIRYALMPEGRDASWSFEHYDLGAPPPLPQFKDPDSVPEIPICSGLEIVTAVAAPDGDYESIKTIKSVDDTKYVLNYSAETKDPWWETLDTSLKVTRTTRSVLWDDARSAFRYARYFVNDGPQDFPGSTSIGVSTKILHFLKTRGEAVLELCVTGDECTSFDTLRIHRVGSASVPVRVLVNGTSVDLPAIQVRATHADAYWMPKLVEMYLLDDERNPLVLSFRFGIHGTPPLTPKNRSQCEEARTNHNIGFSGSHHPSCDQPMGGDQETLRVVKINTDCRAVGSQSGQQITTGQEHLLESKLADAGKVDVYSIFFSFNSDALREESEPTLREIADILKKHADWNLRIAGHTDGVGSDEANLDLSQRRAASVKNALIKEYGIDGARLSTTGFGKKQPIDTNDTVEGRARNRRVELLRIGS